ncbi:hypothetical protein [Herpetosiphon sp.]|uniref:hypothetical protein n=1 Tax=Herpetosiphon sp. TaxID=71864 RepID=UPI00257BCA11|nr:hypothetical protein [Herpetosiphon sp.]
MRTIDTIHRHLNSFQGFIPTPSYPVPSPCRPSSTAPITPVIARTKKTRKPKRQPSCSCPACTKEHTATGVFRCLKGKEYVIFAAGQCLGYRKTEGTADTLLRDYRYTFLTKHAG